MSLDNQLKAGLAELDCSNAVFIAIAKTSSTSKLSQAFSGIKALDSAEALALKKVLDEMKALQADIAAHVGHLIPIAWTPGIRDVLEERRKRLHGVPDEIFWGVETFPGRYFVECVRGRIKTVTDKMEANGMRRSDADKCVATLKSMNYESARVFVHPCVSPDSCQDLDDIWRE